MVLFNPIPEFYNKDMLNQKVLKNGQNNVYPN